MAAYQLADPRSASYPQDSEMWALLLAWSYGDELLAYKQGEECSRSLYGALHGVRCGGARLVRNGRTVRLTAGDWPEDEYAKLRERYLLPHGERLRTLLKNLGHWAQEKDDGKGDDL